VVPAFIRVFKNQHLVLWSLFEFNSVHEIFNKMKFSQNYLCLTQTSKHIRQLGIKWKENVSCLMSVTLLILNYFMAIKVELWSSDLLIHSVLSRFRFSGGQIELSGGRRPPRQPSSVLPRFRLRVGKRKLRSGPPTHAHPLDKSLLIRAYLHSVFNIPAAYRHYKQ